MTVELMKAVFTKLNSDNSFKTAVGGRISALQAPSETAFPLCIYSLDEVNTQRFFSGKVQQRATVVVGLFAEADSGADSIVDLEELLFTLLDEESLTVAGHDRGFVRGINRGTPSIEGELLQLESTFEIVATSNT